MDAPCTQVSPHAPAMLPMCPMYLPHAKAPPPPRTPGDIRIIRECPAATAGAMLCTPSFRPVPLMPPVALARRGPAHAMTALSRRTAFAMGCDTTGLQPETQRTQRPRPAPPACRTRGPSGRKSGRAGRVGRSAEGSTGYLRPRGHRQRMIGVLGCPCLFPMTTGGTADYGCCTRAHPCPDAA